MFEFLIRTAETHDWPGLPSSRFAEVFLPAGFDCEEIDGWGEFRIRCGTTEISFAGEPVGWLVTFEGPMPETDCERLVITLTRQVEQAAGEPCEWVQIT